MSYTYSKPARHPLVLKAGRRLRNTRRKLVGQDAQTSADSAVGFSIRAL